MRSPAYWELVERQRLERHAMSARHKIERRSLPNSAAEINKNADERAYLAASLRLHGCLSYPKIGNFLGVCVGRAREITERGFRRAIKTGAVI